MFKARYSTKFYLHSTRNLGEKRLPSVPAQFPEWKRRKKGSESLEMKYVFTDKIIAYLRTRWWEYLRLPVWTPLMRVILGSVLLHEYIINTFLYLLIYALLEPESMAYCNPLAFPWGFASQSSVSLVGVPYYIEDSLLSTYQGLKWKQTSNSSLNLRYISRVNNEWILFCMLFHHTIMADCIVSGLFFIYLVIYLLIFKLKPG